MKKPGQIVALGGGMFSMEPDNGLLDKYLLNLVPKSKPKICFLGTASNDGKEYREMFYSFFNKKNCQPSHLAFNNPPENIEGFLLDQDIIHVGGGNTKLIIETWKEHGVDKIMRKAWKSGVILSGMSAGAICWFEDGITNPSPGVLTRLPCLGFLKGSFCPHYDERAELRKSFKELILSGIISDGYGVEDGTALHFSGTDLIRIISSRPEAGAYKVEKKGTKVTEEKLQSEYLGKDTDQSLSNGEEVSHSLITALMFVEKVNLHDIKGISDLLTEDHVFVDSMENMITGRNNMITAWEGFLSWFPDYEIEIRDTYVAGDNVAFFGRARGKFNKRLPGVKDRFDIPASWQSTVTNGKISRWQAIADNEIVRHIIDTNGRYEFLEKIMKAKSKVRRT